MSPRQETTTESGFYTSLALALVPRDGNEFLVYLTYPALAFSSERTSACTQCTYTGRGVVGGWWGPNIDTRLFVGGRDLLLCHTRIFQFHTGCSFLLGVLLVPGWHLDLPPYYTKTLPLPEEKLTKENKGSRQKRGCCQYYQQIICDYLSYHHQPCRKLNV